CLVNGGIGCSVDDDIGRGRGNQRSRGAGALEVEFRTAGGGKLDPTTRPSAFDQTLRDLPVRADDEDLHRPVPRRCPAYFRSRIGRHHHSFSRNQATVFSSPVSKLSSALQPSSHSIFDGSSA